jgi:hypothetical protein
MALAASALSVRSLRGLIHTAGLIADMPAFASHITYNEKESRIVFGSLSMF